MKVLHVVPRVAAESSGPTYYIQNLMRQFLAQGVDATLYSLENFRHVKLLNLGWSPEMFATLKRDVHKADIVHNNSLWMFPNIYPYWASRGVNVKVVTSPHGTLSKWALSRGCWKKFVFGSLLQYPALKRTDMFHATSEKEYEEIRALGYKQPVAIVPIGMDVQERRDQVKGSGIRGEMGRLHRVVFFGRLHKVKAIDRLIQAWELLAKEESDSSRHSADAGLIRKSIQNPIVPSAEGGCEAHRDSESLLLRVAEATCVPSLTEWELVIAGPDGGVRSELESYIAAHKIPRVRFVGEINGSAKYDFLSSADLYVLPSHTENFAVTVAEALACGTPVIVSKGTPWSGVVDHHCGWWVENDPETLAQTLREAISLPDEGRRQMGSAGRELIQRDFSWEGVGAKMKAAYEWLLNGGVRPEYVKIK